MRQLSTQRGLSRCREADVVTVQARRHSVSAQRLPHCRAGRESRLRLAHDRAPRHRATAPRSTTHAGYCAPKASWLTLYDCVASSCRSTLRRRQETDAGWRPDIVFAPSAPGGILCASGAFCWGRSGLYSVTGRCSNAPQSGRLDF